MALCNVCFSAALILVGFTTSRAVSFPEALALQAETLGAWRARHARAELALEESKNVLDRFFALLATVSDSQSALIKVCSPRLHESKHVVEWFLHDLLSLSAKVGSQQEGLERTVETLNTTMVAIAALEQDYTMSVKKCEVSSSAQQLDTSAQDSNVTGEIEHEKEFCEIHALPLITQRDHAMAQVEESLQMIGRHEPELARIKDRALALDEHIQTTLAPGCQGVPQVETSLGHIRELVTVLAEQPGQQTGRAQSTVKATEVDMQDPAVERSYAGVNSPASPPFSTRISAAKTKCTCRTKIVNGEEIGRECTRDGAPVDDCGPTRSGPASHSSRRTTTSSCSCRTTMVNGKAKSRTCYRNGMETPRC